MQCVYTSVCMQACLCVFVHARVSAYMCVFMCVSDSSIYSVCARACVSDCLIYVAGEHGEHQCGRTEWQTASERDGVPVMHE